MNDAMSVQEQTVTLSTLGERLRCLRLQSPDAVRTLRASLAQHGQLSAVVALRSGAGGALEVVDGFKRVQAGRALGWPSIRVRPLDADEADAKAAILALNHRSTLTELEEGWLVRSLYRDDHLTQPEIARRLGRHKSWVCRRLMLVEQLCETVATDVRLGLLGARAAVELCRLPRGNQREVGALCARRGLTTRQVARLVSAWLEASDDVERAALLSAWDGDSPPRDGPAAAPSARPTAAESIALDVHRVRRAATRLEARLLERPLVSFGDEGARAVRETLMGLRPALGALRRIAEAAGFDGGAQR